MRFSALLFSTVIGLLSGESLALGSFNRDVVSGVARKERRLQQQQNVEDDLMANALPIDEYKRQLKALGVESPLVASESANENPFRQLEDGEDDYFMNENNMYSFSGYSLKYAKCQPIQQFSEDALLAGEYSPMVTQDVVILRLCPYKSCSSSRQYGCHYNYAEYAIGLNDYIRIMLRYKADKKERLCEWCGECKNRRKLEEDVQDEQGAQEDEAQEENDNNNQNNANDNQGGDDYYKADDAYNQNNGDDGGNYNGQYYDENDDCYMYGSYCENYYYDCDVEGDDQYNNYQNQQYYYQDDYQNQNYNENLIDEDEYFNYLGCTEIKDNYGGIYFVRPSCDTSNNVIAMMPYYDEYCSQSASKVVNMDNLQVGFDQNVFAELYEGECMDCSESNYPPTFNANSYMCNKIHYKGADCTNNMVYDLFDGSKSDSTECSFIESIRFGTYDAYGAISVEATDDAEEVVTDLQKVGLIGSAFICAIFVVYACYLHHSMTNLLIKSLSHRELLPPSRHSKRRSPSRPKRRRSGSKGSKGGRSRGDDEDDEWDRSKPLRSPV